MRRNRLSAGVFVFLLSVFTACNQKSGAEQISESPAFSLSEFMPGKWQNIDLKISLNFESQYADSVIITQADTTNWEAVLHIKPITTFFRADGSFESVYRNLKDSVVHRSAGSWEALGTDSLIMVSEGISYRYFAEKRTENRVFFRSVLDWDNDGKKDDEYTGSQRKISAETN